jgi:hypothetical protein
MHLKLSARCSMAVRLLLMFSIMILELGLGIASILGATMGFYYQLPNDVIAGVVMIVVGILVAWLVTIALFVRKSSRVNAARIVSDAREEAGRILAEATEKALALCSLDGGKCPQCGNPRTGKFCPKCGSGGEVGGLNQEVQVKAMGEGSPVFAGR